MCWTTRGSSVLPPMRGVRRAYAMHEFLDMEDFCRKLKSLAGQGPARPGTAWRGLARRGAAWLGLGLTWRGRAWPGMARHGRARRGKVGHGRARPGTARRGAARQGLGFGLNRRQIDVQENAS